MLRWLSLLLFFLPSIASAHDSWLAQKSESEFAFCTGESFPRSENATKAHRVKSWVWIDAVGKSRPLSNWAPKEQELIVAGKVAPGAQVVAISLHPHFIELAPVEFNEYVVEEGAKHVLEARQKANLVDQPGREYYSKAAKVALGDGRGAQAIVGHPLELVLASPVIAPPGRTTEFRVLFEGKPKSGVRVSLGKEGMAAHAYSATEVSDAQGVVRFQIAEAGQHFLRAQLMRARDPKSKVGRPPRSPDGKVAGDAEWESFWASLTFKVAS